MSLKMAVRPAELSADVPTDSSTIGAANPPALGAALGAAVRTPFHQTQRPAISTTDF